MGEYLCRRNDFNHMGIFFSSIGSVRFSGLIEFVEFAGGPMVPVFAIDATGTVPRFVLLREEDRGICGLSSGLDWRVPPRVLLD